jgi:hypothetical protein
MLTVVAAYSVYLVGSTLVAGSIGTLACIGNVVTRLNFLEDAFLEEQKTVTAIGKAAVQQQAAIQDVIAWAFQVNAALFGVQHPDDDKRVPEPKRVLN